MASQRAIASGSAVCRLAFIGKPVRGRFTVSFHSGITGDPVRDVVRAAPMSQPGANWAEFGYSSRTDGRDSPAIVLLGTTYNSLMAPPHARSQAAAAVHEEVLGNG